MCRGVVMCCRSGRFSPQVKRAAALQPWKGRGEKKCFWVEVMVKEEEGCAETCLIYA